MYVGGMSIEKNDIKTVREADHFLHDLNRAAGYCRGPESSKAHAERIREVEKWRDELLIREEKP